MEDRMPFDPNADTEITAFAWVPPFAAGLVRDLRIRWACEEIGKAYSVRLLDAVNPRPAEYLCEQPFDQVPAYKDPEVQLFESGAILIHLGMSDERLLPREPQPRMRAISWLIAALNSVEPALSALGLIDIFHQDEEWAKLRRPGADELARLKLKRVADWLGDKAWLEGQFTIGDLMMVSVLRNLRHTDLVSGHPVLGPYLDRGEARPAFQRALADQVAIFAQHQPQGAAA
jgi:glutathione S-transferase